MLGNEKSDDASELGLSGHGAATLGRREMASPPPKPPGRDLSRRIDRGRSRLEDTLSPGDLSKESLSFSLNEPAVHSAFHSLRFHFLKAHFRRFESIYAFQYLQNCH